MLRHQIIKKYLAVDDILAVIWHNSSIFLASLLKTLLFLFVLFILYVVLQKYIFWEFLPAVFAFLWIGFLIKYLLDFFDDYLDTLILSHAGITLFTWDGILRYKTDFFARERIETISYVQHTLWDKLFAKWDLVITLDRDVEFPFENVSRPQKQMARILKYKDQFSKNLAHSAHDDALQDEKISILAEALGEVVKEYLDKKGKNDEEEDELF